MGQPRPRGQRTKDEMFCLGECREKVEGGENTKHC